MKRKISKVVLSVALAVSTAVVPVVSINLPVYCYHRAIIANYHRVKMTNQHRNKKANAPGTPF